MAQGEQHESVTSTVESDADVNTEVQQPASTPEESVQQPDAQAEPDIEVQPARQEAHPLEPGGERFKQVWARGKDAEYKLQQERERAARLEGELQALKATQQAKPAEPIYTMSQLQAFVDEGKISQAQALDYWAKQSEKEAERKAEAKFNALYESKTKTSTIQQELDKYKSAVPEILQAGTPEYLKMEREHTYLVNMGYDATDPRTAVLAARTAFGDPASISQRKKAATIPGERPTMQDVQTTGSSGTKPAQNDPLKSLSPAQKAHYQKMIANGMYPNGWKVVAEELAWSPGR